jgi:hypothetical protein
MGARRFLRFSLRFEAMFMQSARLSENSSGESSPVLGGRMEGELKPCPTWIEKGHGMPFTVLFA